MKKIKRIEYPFTLAKVKDLRVGDTVTVSGRIYTARDRVHKYLNDGYKSPVDLKDGAIFHCGPVVIRKDRNWVVEAAGPTTSKRQDAYMPKIIEKHRVRVIIGKGGMGEATRKACRKYGCVYLQTVGGAAALIADRIEKVVGGHLIREFGTAEAIWEFLVKDLQAVVTMDTGGRSHHRNVMIRSRKELKKLAESSI